MSLKRHSVLLYIVYHETVFASWMLKRCRQLLMVQMLTLYSQSWVINTYNSTGSYLLICSLLICHCSLWLLTLAFILRAENCFMVNECKEAKFVYHIFLVMQHLFTSARIVYHFHHSCLCLVTLASDKHLMPSLTPSSGT